MKNLNSYIDQPLSELLDKYGAFFAFSTKQFEEKRKEGVQYVSMGVGLICPKENANNFNSEYDKIIKNGIEQDLKEHGKEAIIRRELANREAYYTGEVDDTFEALRKYDITIEEIKTVYHQNARC